MPTLTASVISEMHEQEDETIVKVRKRNGSLEEINPDKITKRINYCAHDLKQVNARKVAEKVISSLHEGVSTTELDKLAVQTASLMIVEEPQYSKLAARILNVIIEEEIAKLAISSFSSSIKQGYLSELISDKTKAFVLKYSEELDKAIDHTRTDLFEFFGLKTVYDRYLLKHPITREVIENPQYFIMRVGCGLADTLDEALEFYELVSKHFSIPSTPTLFNSGTKHSQMSSCYLLDSPEDSIEGIFDRYKEIAKLSKYAGGIGVAFHKIRGTGSLIKGTNGLSNGIVPFLKMLDSNTLAIDQGGRRKGATCVYLEAWHSDIEEFLDLRKSTGNHDRRTNNLNLANWVPDLFMKRVKEDKLWSLFDPAIVPNFPDIWGEEFEREYEKAEHEEKFTKQIPARELYAKMMRSLAETGNGWMNWKDASNRKSNQTQESQNVIHSSNLCTEIVEITSNNSIAVCNLHQINLVKYIKDDKFDFQLLGKNTQRIITFLDKVIDKNFYPVEYAKDSNYYWRPIGLGIMGLQDVFFQLNLPFDSIEAKQLSKKIQETIYYNALLQSCNLAKIEGPCPAHKATRASEGILQFDLWDNTELYYPTLWQALKQDIRHYGLKNSLTIAIAPTATVSSILGVSECIEPQQSNVFKRETLSGEFLQINKYLVEALRELNLWTESIRDQIKAADGSIQDIKEIPDHIKQVYRTVWEIPMKSLIDMAADRGPFIDQSQSLNLFVESPTIGKLSSMYMYAWEKGLKTTYYLRSRPATKISKVTTNGHKVQAEQIVQVTDEQIIACSINSKDGECESCQ